MENISPEQIEKRYSVLAKALQDALWSAKTRDAVNKTCVLREVEWCVGRVGKLTGRVLLGYLRPELFALEIQKETGMDMQKAQLVAHDLDMEIFSAVRLELKKLYPPTIQTPTVQTWKAESRITNYELRKTAEPQAKPRYVIPIPEKFLRPEVRNQSGETRSPTTGSINHPEARRPQIATQTSDSQWAETKSPQAQRQISQQPTELSGQESGLEEKKTEESRQSPIPPPVPTLKANEANEAKEANEAPSFKPIVPLPTFIQTQFRTTQVDSQKIAGNMARSDLQQPVNKFTPGAYSKTNSFGSNFKSVSGGPTSERAEAGTQENSLADDPQIKNLISKFTSSATQKPKPPAESPYREKI